MNDVLDKILRVFALNSLFMELPYTTLNVNAEIYYQDITDEPIAERKGWQVLNSREVLTRYDYRNNID